jgi:hypothetical protein
MAETRHQLEYWTYEKTDTAEAHQRVTAVGANGELLTTSLDGISYLNLLSEWPFLAVDNNIKANYPTATRETYEFRKDLTVVLTLQVDYTDSTKNVLSEVRRIV